MHKKWNLGILLSSLFFCLVSMSVMFFYMDTKAVNISEAQDVVTQVTDTVQGDGGAEQLRFKVNDVTENGLSIPLNKGVKAEDISIENHYMTNQVWVYLDGTPAAFYKSNALSGNLEKITAATYEISGGKVLLKFTLENIYECKTTLEEKILKIEFVSPRDIYEKIVVIDVAYGGEETGIVQGALVEKDIVLDVAKRLKGLLDTTDIKVYYTRLSDVNVETENRVRVANALQADMLVSLHLNSSEDAESYGAEAFFNADYFIPEFGNAELADCMERNLVSTISTRGNGVFADEKNELLQKAYVPATVLKLGYASNVREAELLMNEKYRDLIAQGLYTAIVAAYSNQ